MPSPQTPPVPGLIYLDLPGFAWISHDRANHPSQKSAFAHLLSQTHNYFSISAFSISVFPHWFFDILIPQTRDEQQSNKRAKGPPPRLRAVRRTFFGRIAKTGPEAAVLASLAHAPPHPPPLQARAIFRRQGKAKLLESDTEILREQMVRRQHIESARINAPLRQRHVRGRIRKRSEGSAPGQPQKIESDRAKTDRCFLPFSLSAGPC